MSADEMIAEARSHAGPTTFPLTGRPFIATGLSGEGDFSVECNGSTFALTFFYKHRKVTERTFRRHMED